jgi:hypothetical protein
LELGPSNFERGLYGIKASKLAKEVSTLKTRASTLDNRAFKLQKGSSML